MTSYPTLPDYVVENYVIPLFSAALDGRATLHGTAFFINGEGVFLTARHVIESAQSAAAQNGGYIFLAERQFESDRASIHPVKSVEFAHLPFDVGIGKVSAETRSFLRLADLSAGAPLRDVSTFGYPESAHTRTAEGRLIIRSRAHKGYIVRRLRGDEMDCSTAPGFELNFPIPSALSGAPLVLHRPATAQEHELMSAPGMMPVGALVDVRFMPKHALHLIGICIGTTQAETVDFSYKEIIDGNTTFSERTSKIELYGLGHDLLPLANWRPTCLGGNALGDAIQPT